MGAAATRALNDKLATELEAQGYTVTNGAGRGPEEWFAGPNGGTKGGTFVDLTATKEGSITRIQTYSTLADGVTPIPSESAAEARILNKYPNDPLKMVPKS